MPGLEKRRCAGIDIGSRVAVFGAGLLSELDGRRCVFRAVLDTIYLP